VALKVGGSSPLGHPRSERKLGALRAALEGHSLLPVVARRPRDRGAFVVWRELGQPTFRPILRTYQPGPAILDGTYPMPDFQRKG
jgi:hypothetical protein